jgi:hypothetical protein
MAEGLNKNDPKKILQEKSHALSIFLDLFPSERRYLEPADPCPYII